MIVFPGISFQWFVAWGMRKDLFADMRKSHMQLDEIYFWTATINSWYKLLWPDKYKDVVIQSLDYLSGMNKIDVFGFVIMPNHIHLIWRILDFNGNETAQGSFLKYTAHQFRKMLYREDRKQLLLYKVDAGNKKHEFWQRDPLAIHLYTSKVAYQKLDYIHRNPMAEHWQLVKDPCDYTYSSASYYELNEKRFNFLKDLREEF